jgi:hypothetical protein
MGPKLKPIEEKQNDQSINNITQICESESLQINEIHKQF